MEDVRALFEGKKVTLLGLGLLGRGVGDAKFLAESNARLTVTDVKTRAELESSVALLEKYPNVEFHLGESRKEDFVHADLVIKAAGVPLNSPEIALAKENNVQVAMSTALFANYAMERGATIVGVTGTRGKSTTAQMIFEVLKGAGMKVMLGGNVRGVSTLAMLPDVTKDTIAVLELDSWQLQGFGDLHISPHVAVFTNLMPDHLNYYDGDMEKYFADKANIFRYQKDNDILVNNPNLAEKIRPFRPLAKVHRVEPHAPVPQEWCPNIIGEHNLYNAALAFAVLEAMGISKDEILAGLKTFKPVEGRLQFVREVKGIQIYNDNNATTPDATIAALEALGKNITLIIGGSEKGLPLDQLVSEIKKNVSHVVLLIHENYKGSARLAEELNKAEVTFEEAGSLQDAVKTALRKVQPYGAVLFSPAFASFGMFKNEYERNDAFLDIVRAL